MYKLLNNLVCLLVAALVIRRAKRLLTRAESDPENSSAIRAKARRLVDVRGAAIERRLIH